MALHLFFVCSPNTEEANQKLLEVFQDLAQEQGAGQCVPPIMQPRGVLLSQSPTTAPTPRVLKFLGRELVVPRAAGSLALLTFEDLCSKVKKTLGRLENKTRPVQVWYRDDLSCDLTFTDSVSCSR